MTLIEMRDRAIKCFDSKNLEDKVLGEVWYKAYVYAGGKRKIESPNRIGDKMRGNIDIVEPLDIVFKIMYCKRDINVWKYDGATMQRIIDRINNSKRVYRLLNQINRDGSMTVGIMRMNNGGIVCVAKKVVALEDEVRFIRSIEELIVEVVSGYLVKAGISHNINKIVYEVGQMIAEVGKR